MKESLPSIPPLRSNESREQFFRNPDFVSPETYAQLFRDSLHDGDTVLNVGAGYAGGDPVSEGLRTSGRSVTLIPFDYNHERTKSWYGGTSSYDADAVPVTGDATQLPFPDSSIALYISTNLVNEPRADDSEVVFVQTLFSEAFRVLTPGGHVVLSSFGYFRWIHPNGAVLYNDAVDTEEIVSVAQVERYLREAGFVNIERIPLDMSQMQHAAEEREMRKGDGTRVDIVEACAFHARKP